MLRRLSLIGGLQLRTVFSDAVRRKKLDNAIQYADPNSKAAVPITWDPDYVSKLIAPLRNKLRAVDFVVEVRDARIPVSTLHPQLRAWAGKKPRVMVLNKSDLISHRDKMEWERHFEQKNIQVGQKHEARDAYGVTRDTLYGGVKTGGSDGWDVMLAIRSALREW